jgi:dihydroorotase
MTFLRGNLVAENGVIVDETARGRMVRPHMPPPAPRNTATTMQAVMRPGAVPWDTGTPG